MSEFWKEKMRTYLYTFDYDKDGYISEQDIADMAYGFADVYNATPEKKENLVSMFKSIWRKCMKAGDLENDPRLTLTVLIESIKQQFYDPDLMITIVQLARSVLEIIDVNQDGYLHPEEFSEWIKNLGVPEGTFDPKFAFDAVDVNGDGKVSIKEFTAAFFDFIFSQDESSPNKYFFGPLVDESKYP